MTQHVTSRRPDDATQPLQPYIDEWLRTGIISPDQARRMLATSQADATSPTRVTVRTPVLLEAAGYLGGALVVVAAILIGVRYWTELSTPVRLTTVGGATAVLMLAGFVVAGRAGEVGRRLWTVLWLASIGTAAGFLGLAVDATSAFVGHEPAVTTAGTAVYAVALWSAHRILVHQVVAVGTLLATIGTVIADVATSQALPGVGVWAFAGVWFVLGMAGVLRPRRAVLALAAAAMVLGSMMTLPQDWGFALALGNVALLLGLALYLRDLLLLGVASLGALQALPAAALEWFPDSVAAPFVLLGTGVLLVGAAVWTARGRGERG